MEGGVATNWGCLLSSASSLFYYYYFFYLGILSGILHFFQHKYYLIYIYIYTQNPWNLWEPTLYIYTKSLDSLGINFSAGNIGNLLFRTSLPEVENNSGI